MIKVHQCEVMSESAKYILIDECHLDDHFCATFRYEIETTNDKADGHRVDWLNCPYCREKL
jgi:hypothetical protein